MGTRPRLAVDEAIGDLPDSLRDESLAVCHPAERRSPPQPTAQARPRSTDSNSQLRAIAEEYGSSGGDELVLDAFVRGWVKVMENDRVESE